MENVSQLLLSPHMLRTTSEYLYHIRNKKKSILHNLRLDEPRETLTSLKGGLTLVISVAKREQLLRFFEA